MEKGTSQRGSERLFAAEAKSEAFLAEALGSARGDYRVKWWWKYGQPRIDHIIADLEFDKERFGPSFGQIMGLNSPRLQISAEVFPYGLPVPDLFRVRLDIRQPG